MLAPLDEVSETTSGVATPVLEVRDREAQQLGGPRDYGSISATLDRAGDKGSQRSRRRFSLSSRSSASSSAIDDDDEDVRLPDEASILRTRLSVAVAFSAVSGTLSGLCLLLAKSGVELLVLTFGLGNNQFNRLGSWALVVIMLLAALAQLWYLNKALKMADPTLVCPLAFCFYNTSSIALGLVYFDQLDSLTTSSLLLVILGTAILLAGVFIVSTKPQATAPVETSDDESTALMQQSQTSEGDNFVTSPSNLTSSPTETEALLANAAGIAGPHLPPPTSPPSTVTPQPQVTVSSPDRGTRGHRRSVSAGSVVTDGLPMTAGLGLHLPSYYLENETDHRREQSVPQASPKRRAASTSAANVSGASTSRSTLSNTVTATNGSSTSNGTESPQAPRTPPQQHSRRPSQNLYSTILNRGLSIGIGPSSPGFHIGPFSPSQYDDEDEATEEDNQRRDEVARRDRTRTRARRKAGHGRVKRTFSEADVDVESIAASAADGSDQEQGLEEEEGEDDSEAARSVSGDLASLPRRLKGLTNRSWFSNARQWWKQNVTRVGEEEEQRRRERRALLA